MSTFILTGHTYPHRADMRALGGSWDRNAKGWRFTDRNAARDAAAKVGPSAAVVDESTGQVVYPIQAPLGAPVPAGATVQVRTAPDYSATAQANARTILGDIVAHLTPRALADAMMAGGASEADAIRTAVHAHELVKLAPIG